MLVKDVAAGSPAQMVLSAPKTSWPYKLGILVLSLAYGLGFASLPVDVFQDRANYFDYAQSSLLLLFRYFDGGWLSALTNEPVWLLMNSGLSLWFEPETIVRIVIFVSATVGSYAVLREGPKHFVWLLLILLIPNVVKNYVIHLRQGLAIAIFMLGWQSTKPFWRLSLFALAPLIHASFFFVLLLLVLSAFTQKLRFAADLRFASFLITGLGAAVMLGVVAQMLGARQAEYYSFSSEEISGLGFIFWSVVLVLFIIGSKQLQSRNSFAIGAMIFYLSSYFFIELSGRIFESALLVVLLAGLNLRGWSRQMYVGAILVYGLSSWLLRLNEPWLGFGIG